jgi:hypothetical protein
MKYLSLFLVVVAGMALSCQTYNPNPQTEKTQLQIREFQTRTFDVDNELMVMKAVASVLLDEGFIIKDAETDLGIISATKELDIESGSEKFFSILFFGANARWAKNSIIESTVNVSSFGKQVKVRVIFQVKSMNNKGEVMVVQQVDDEQYYQDFFAKVDKGIFIQKENI